MNRFVIHDRLLLKPKLSREHKGSCVLAMAYQEFPRFISHHYEGMNCYKFSDWDKACLMAPPAAANVYTTNTNLPTSLSH